MITHQINLDMVPGGAPEVIHFSQYDNDATLIFSLYASSGLFTVAEGTTVAIRGTKSDGNGISLDAAISGTTVTVDLDQQITAVAGRNIFELTLYKNGKELNTANFIIDVERAAMDADTISSESDIKELAVAAAVAEQMIAAAATFEENRNEIRTVATNAGNIQELSKNISSIVIAASNIGDIQNAEENAASARESEANAAESLRQVEMYADVLIPSLYFDPDTAILYKSDSTQGADFYLDEDSVLWFKLIATA